jgi:hypothetical protein
MARGQALRNIPEHQGRTNGCETNPEGAAFNALSPISVSYIAHKFGDWKADCGLEVVFRT